MLDVISRQFPVAGAKTGSSAGVREPLVFPLIAHRTRNGTEQKPMAAVIKKASRPLRVLLAKDNEINQHAAPEWR
jgi:hypothetical protein